MYVYMLFAKEDMRIEWVLNAYKHTYIEILYKSATYIQANAHLYASTS